MRRAELYTKFIVSQALSPAYVGNSLLNAYVVLLNYLRSLLDTEEEPLEIVLDRDNPGLLVLRKQKDWKDEIFRLNTDPKSRVFENFHYTQTQWFALLASIGELRKEIISKDPYRELEDIKSDVIAREYLFLLYKLGFVAPDLAEEYASFLSYEQYSKRPRQNFILPPLVKSALDRSVTPIKFLQRLAEKNRGIGLLNVHDDKAAAKSLSLILKALYSQGHRCYFAIEMSGVAQPVLDWFAALPLDERIKHRATLEKILTNMIWERKSHHWDLIISTIVECMIQGYKVIAMDEAAEVISEKKNALPLDKFLIERARTGDDMMVRRVGDRIIADYKAGDRREPRIVVYVGTAHGAVSRRLACPSVYLEGTMPLEAAISKIAAAGVRTYADYAMQLFSPDEISVSLGAIRQAPISREPEPLVANLREVATLREYVMQGLAKGVDKEDEAAVIIAPLPFRQDQEFSLEFVKLLGKPISLRADTCGAPVLVLPAHWMCQLSDSACKWLLAQLTWRMHGEDGSKRFSLAAGSTS